MAKARTQYVCQTCGHTSPRWLGQCPDCGAWGTFAEETVATEAAPKAVAARKAGGTRSGPGRTPLRLSDVTLTAEHRLQTGLGEFDRVLGGGLLRGAFVLVAGDPGIGKSTLMTQLGALLPQETILYVTGEESPRQVKLRAERLGVTSENFHLLAETNVEDVAHAVQANPPGVLIVDSIQTLYRPDLDSAPGSVSQVRESAATLLHLAKSLEVPTFLVGHVTKNGQVAGPRVLEHMVDTVLYFEGDRHHGLRILRATKNRFGSTNEIGVFEMTGDGLREVANPSELFLSERQFGASGSAVVPSLEGSRPLLVEVQALVTPTAYGTPQRTATGFDGRRLQLLLAVLEKRAGMRLSTHDVFVNVAGGATPRRARRRPRRGRGHRLVPPGHPERLRHGVHRRGGPRGRTAGGGADRAAPGRGRAPRVCAGGRAEGQPQKPPGAPGPQRGGRGHARAGPGHGAGVDASRPLSPSVAARHLPRNRGRTAAGARPARRQQVGASAEAAGGGGQSSVARRKPMPHNASRNPYSCPRHEAPL